MNIPPVDAHGGFAPPHPSGHGLLREWAERLAPSVPDRGAVHVPDDVRAVCVDFNGVTKARAGACVGAFRWPERQVVWAKEPA